MKIKSILSIALVSIALIFASCVKEGPAGIAGQDGKDGLDGADGQDGSVTCMACHTEATISARQFQYASSGHKAALYVGYAGGRPGCADCHSGTGFIERMTNGTNTVAIANPDPINCTTCHMLHTSFTYADLGFRGGDAVTFIFDGTSVFDKDDGSNVCVNCHQSRRAEPNVDVPGETFEITSTHYGPHHGPQANVFAGVGFAEIDGPVAYPEAGSSVHFNQASCVKCHMGEYTNGEGGHTWKPNLAACNECHTTDSFDYGGTQTATLIQLEELRDLLVAQGVVVENEDGSYSPVKGTYPMVQAQAFFNWVGLEEDRSEGVHNPKYFNALLINSIQALKDTPYSDPTILSAYKVTSAPIVDGTVDALWANVPELDVRLGETNNPPNDPSQVGNCAGCHAFNSDIAVTLKATYDNDNIYILAQWPDPTASFTRGNSWNWDGTLWSRTDHTAQSEDRLAFFWPMGTIAGAPYSTGGCMTKCHMYYPTDTDPHVSSHAIVDDAWLTEGRADMWHSKAARGAAYLGASGTNLTIDPVTYEVTAGTFTQLGYADDKYVDVWKNDAENGEDGGRYGDAGGSGYAHNRIGDKSRPKWIEKNPTDYADAMTLLQSEIDGGECAGDATTGVSDADALLYYPAYTALTAVVPERILRLPGGSRGDINFGAVWNDGTWTAEFGRKLNTTNDDDINFTDLTMQYLFNVAEFDNSRHGYEHRVSESYFLKFIQ